MSKKWIAILSVIALVVLYASFITSRMKFGSDAIDYYRIAESISAGRGYTIDGTFVSKWPPVTPLMVALGFSLFNADVAGIKVLFGCLSFAGLLMSYLLLKHRDEEPLGIWSVGITAVSLPFIYWVLDFSSEGPYFFWTMASLWLGQLAFDEKKKPLFAILAGICIGMSFLTRTAGAAMIGGLIFYAGIALITKRSHVTKPLLLMLIPVLLLAGGWTFYAKHQGGESSIKTYGKYAFRPDIYDPTGTGSLVNSLTRATKNIQGYAFIFSIPDSSLRAEKMKRLNVKGLVSMAIMLLALVGFAGNMMKRIQFAECYLLVYGGVLLVVNWYDIRYVVPIMPLLFYYVGWTLRRFSKPAVVNGILACVLIGNLGISVASPPAKRLRSAEYHGFAKNFHNAVMWIKINDPKAVVMCAPASMAWFWTRMTVKNVPFNPDTEAVWQYMVTANATIVIDYPDDFSGVNEKYLKPVIKSHNNSFIPIMQFGDVTIYRISRSSSTNASQHLLENTIHE